MDRQTGTTKMKYFELDYELAVTLTNVMEGAGEGHSAQGHSNGAPWFRSIASAG